MPGTPEQRLPRQVQWVECEWLLQNFGGSIVVRQRKRKPRHRPSLKFQLGAVSHRLVDVLVPTCECSGIEDGEVDLVPEKIVVVSPRERVLARKQVLFKSSFKPAIFLTLQIRIRNDSLSPGECFFKPRRLDSRRVREAHAGSRKQLATSQELPGNSDFRDPCISESSVVDKTCASDDR